jgi:hypothetical protein
MRGCLAASLLLLIVGRGDKAKDFYDRAVHAEFSASQLPSMGDNFESFPAHNP